jgi:hypothetical protein
VFKPVQDQVGEGPARAKPKAMKALKDDREVEDVVMSYLVKRGQAIARTILENYDIMRGEHPTKIARLLAVMRSVAEKDPGLVVEGTCKIRGWGSHATSTAGNHNITGIKPPEFFLINIVMKGEHAWKVLRFFSSINASMPAVRELAI